VGKPDIEDAPLRLENAILEEMRMAAAEALKGIQVQGIVEDRMRGVEVRLRVSGTCYKASIKEGRISAQRA
jgi:hypothetical protein